MGDAPRRGRDAGNAPDFRLIVGLGNPGDAYLKTRHNVGFMVVEELAASSGGRFQQSGRLPGLTFCRTTVSGADIFLAMPLEYMNNSGPPTQRLCGYYKIHPTQVIVVHDEIDLEFGQIKIKEKGGHGGHNGVRSLIGALGQNDFVRVRVGIGRSQTGNSVTNHVLTRFGPDESPVLDQIITRAREAVVTILREGVKQGMNHYNRKVSSLAK